MTLVTEKEAAEKWCPMFRVGAWNGHELFTNRDRATDDHRDVHTRCIGSRCMAWRWGTDEWEPSEQIWSPGGGSYTTETPPGPREGYCGAFGKVEP